MAPIEPDRIRRDLMAPDTEPTEAELEVVMRAAARVVRERKQDSDAWLQRQLRDAVAQATGNAPAGKPRP